MLRQRYVHAFIPAGAQAPGRTHAFGCGHGADPTRGAAPRSPRATRAVSPSPISTWDPIGAR